MPWSIPRRLLRSSSFFPTKISKMDISPLILSLIYQLFANAAFLFLAALGLIIILGMMNIINLAHGEFMMMGAYVATITYPAGVPFVISVILSFIVVAIIGDR